MSVEDFTIIEMCRDGLVDIVRADKTPLPDRPPAAEAVLRNLYDKTPLPGGRYEYEIELAMHWLREKGMVTNPDAPFTEITPDRLRMALFGFEMMRHPKVYKMKLTKLGEKRAAQLIKDMARGKRNK